VDQQGTEHDLEPTYAIGQSADSTELTVLFTHLKRYFDGRVDTDDLDILVFALHYLFCSADTLYQLALPDLAKHPEPLQSRPRENDAEDQTVPLRKSEPPLIQPDNEVLTSRHRRAKGADGAQTGCKEAPETSKPQDTVGGLLRRHHHWIQLQAIQQLLERLSSLCQLLNTTVSSLLDALDTNLPPALKQETPTQPFEQYLQHLTQQEQWDEAVRQLSETLSDWQQQQHNRRVFSQRFTDLDLEDSPAEIDTGFDLLLDYVTSIFAEILLDFQAVSTGDDEAVATLLLDLLQKVDQAHVQITMLHGAIGRMVRKTKLL
jgi:hypothetical protein